MIKTFKSSGSGFKSPLAIAPESQGTVNWVTVFIAENGGRKSYLLRLIAEASLGRRRYSPSRGSSVFFDPIDQPSKVIAISGTPLDRFPRTGTTDLKNNRRSKQYSDFVYLGQRASNGMAGVQQSERSLVGCLLANRHLLSERYEALVEVFKHLGLDAAMRMHLKRADVRKSIKEYLSSKGFSDWLLDLRYNERKTTEDEALLKLFNQRGYSDLAERTEKEFQYSGSGKSIILSDGRIRQRPGSLSIAEIELLLRSGAIEIEGTEFKRAGKPNYISGEYLSSGQWGWLGSFGPLVVELRDRALILVDEPENSLHPTWQRNFMPNLKKILDRHENCQAIVATHSPLIASGVSADWGNIRTLKRANRIDAVVRSEPLTTTFGWSASDVYDELFAMDTTRAPGFLKVANTALRKLSNSSPITSSQASAWSSRLSKDIQSLPPFDPLREVLDTIVARLAKII